MLRKLRTVALVLALLCLAGLLLLLPAVARWFYLYEGEYRPESVARPDLSNLEIATPEMSLVVDREVAPTSGTILVDRAHDNRFEWTELGVLQSHLAARGRHLEPVTAAENLRGQLRAAQALVVISPGKNWTASEIGLVRDFVDSGGRLLLVTDATRFKVLTDDLGTPIGYDNDVVHVSDLAGQFGVIFQADYLYNTVDYESNFRNVKLTRFAANDLTRGLKQVVFYAAHSIVAEGTALISASGETRSSNSDRTDGLVAAALTREGAVLALGDVTFLSEPYSAVADNDRFIANIADFLGGAHRRYELADFPLFLGDKVDLVYCGDRLLEGDLLPAVSALQAAIDSSDRKATVRQGEDRSHDTVFLGLYQAAHDVEPYLAAAGVTVWFSPTTTSSEAAKEELDLAQMLGLAPPLTVTEEVTSTAQASPTATNRIETEALGRVALTDTALILLEDHNQRQVLVILSDTGAGLRGAVQRLLDRDLADCVLSKTRGGGTLALCPTTVGGEGQGRTPSLQGELRLARNGRAAPGPLAAVRDG